MAEALIGPGAIRGTSPRIAWLSVLQGLGMLLVVLGHGWLTTFDDPEHGVVSAVVATIYHFHMPLFFAISGYLFWATRVTRDWSFPAVLGEKTLRFLWPFLVFTALAFSMKAFIPGLPGKRMLTNGWSALKVLAYPAQNPLGELWFIASLFTMFLLYPVL
ncbi:MAG TPA: acyltransferase family protein, partial [Fibrobacteria bacterium]|nr:acyltransferase family protein [Fibrobacteria bacterium]